MELQSPFLMIRPGKAGMPGAFTRKAMMDFIKRSKQQKLSAEMASLVSQVGERVNNIYVAKGYCCAEAIMVGLNGIFGVGLTDELALAMASPFCHGLGGAGCVCGALAGSELMLGALLSWRGERGVSKKEFNHLSKEMHDRFKGQFKGTCCRLLRKRRREKKGASCQELTQGGAEIIVEIMLLARPELATRVNYDFLAMRDSRARHLLKKALGKE